MQVALRYTKFLMWPSAVLAGGLLLLQWLEYRLVIVDSKVEVYSAVIAGLFLALGYQLSKQLSSKSAATTQHLLNDESQTELVIDEDLLIASSKKPTQFKNNSASESLSVRELEVLQLMAKGLSNQEISEKLFISLSTVKTHCSSIYVKLDVKRRTGAVQKASVLGLLS